MNDEELRRLDTQQGYIRGTRDTDDVSYQRPISLDGPPTERW